MVPVKKKSILDFGLCTLHFIGILNVKWWSQIAILNHNICPSMEIVHCWTHCVVYWILLGPSIGLKWAVKSEIRCANLLVVRATR